jgi:hypothetical protein
MSLHTLTLEHPDLADKQAVLVGTDSANVSWCHLAQVFTMSL